jgi:RluA family pseudouridine synthase
MFHNNHPERVENLYTFNITKGQKPERIDTYLTRSIPYVSRNKVQNAINYGNVLVNGKQKKVSYKISPNDIIECKVLQLPPIEITPENIPLEIIYEDEHLLVINKSAGMCVHPGIGNRSGTLLNALLFHLGLNKINFVEDEENDSEFDENDIDYQDISNIRAGLVHRIDKDTSGLLVVAKTLFVHSALSKQFATKTTEREYVAIV